MKKARFLRLAVAVAILSILATVLFAGMTSAATVKVTYKYNGYVSEVYVQENEEFFPMGDVDGYEDAIFYGWADAKGNLYPVGKGATVSQDTTLYPVYGGEVSTEKSFFDAVEAGYTYVKLTANVGIFDAINLKDDVFVIDTNGYSLTINTPNDAIAARGAGIAFIGGGKVVHNYMGATPEFTMDSFIKLSPTSSIRNLFVTVASGTTVETPIDFISVMTNIDRFSGVFNASVYGSVSCKKLMLTRGISEGAFSIYEGAVVDTDCEFFFEDLSTTEAKKLITLTVYGGTIYTNQLNSYAKDIKKYQMAILGGQFSEDITDSFPDKNYSFKYNAKGFYEFSDCACFGPIIDGMPDFREPDACTRPGIVLTYQCQYCNSIYEDSETYKDTGIGHYFVTEATQPLIVTQEMTQEGINRIVCKRCGYVDGETYVYPDPTTVYVTVKYYDDALGKEQSLRAPANRLFDFDPANSTYVMGFAPGYLGTEYEIARKDIRSIEIPLGVKTIYGEEKGGNIYGLFANTDYLTEIVLPSSIELIQKNAFRNMANLKTVVGLEKVRGTIETCAFYQEHTNVHFDQLTINASSIGVNAFHNFRMNSLTIGTNVARIESGAFSLDVDEANGIKPVQEIIIVGNTMDGVTVKDVFDEYNDRSYSATNQQFARLPVVYADHQCDVEVTPPTCASFGYTTHTCKYCSYVLVDSETSKLEHRFEVREINSTCIVGGYTVEICGNCEEVKPGSIITSDIPNDNHSFTTKKGYIFYDEEEGHMAYYQSYKILNVGSAGIDKFLGFYDENNNRIEGKEYYICDNKYANVVVCDLCGVPDWSMAPSVSYLWTAPIGYHDADTSRVIATIQPTCGDEGFGVAECKNCQKKIEMIIPITGKSHAWGNPTVVTPATCMEVGVQEFRCKNCTTAVKLGEIPMLDPEEKESHSYDEGRVVREPTYTAAGIKQFTCTVEGCDNFYTEGINVLIQTETEIPTWMIAAIIAGGAVLALGVFLTLYFTLFKKKRASDSFKYKFNTLKK